MNTYDLKGKSAIVTGGCGHLARQMVVGLSSAGVRVVVIDALEHTHENAINLGAYAGIKGDLSTEEGCRNSFSEAARLLDNKLDILVNAVGIGSKHRPEDFPFADWQRVISINLSSYFYMSSMAAKIMLKEKKGRIINIGSMGSFISIPDNAAYCSSKGGVELLTRSLARDLSSSGINVNGIAPGFMDTPLNKIKNDPIEGPFTLKRISQGRLGTGQDLVGPLLFLCSEASNYITGVMLPVDGGYLA